MIKKIIKWIGFVLIVYLFIAIILTGLFFGDVTKCNISSADDPETKDSLLCKPTVYLVVLPAMGLSEFFETLSGLWQKNI